MVRKSFYLDANGHVNINQKALDAYIKFSNSIAGHGHPSSLSKPGREAALAMEEARGKIAELIGAENSNQIIFTSSCTQACEWGLKLFFDIEKNNYSKDNIAVSPLEHPAVKTVCESLQLLPCTQDGIVEDNLNNSDISKIICVHMQNEIGTIQPIKTLKRKYIFSDMSQSLGKMPINVTDLNVDIAAFGAHKFGGPSGIGFMYLRNIDWWQPFGKGSRYYTDISGSSNVSGIVATAVALEEAIKTLPERTQKMQAFQKTLEIGLKNLGLNIIGDGAPRSFNTTYVSGLTQAQTTLLELSELGIYVGLGSACSSYSSNISPLIKVLGYNYTTDNVMRISQWGEYNDTDAINFLNIFKKVL